MSNTKRLYHNDAYNQIDDFIADGLKVDAIITDPPYNISKSNNFNTMRGRTGIDFGEWDKGFDMCGWIPKYTKLLNDNGCIIIFCSYTFISHIYDTLIENGIDVKDVLVWRKSNPMPRNIDRRYVPDMEFALWGVKKGAKWVFNRPNGVPYLRSMYETSIVSGKEKLGHTTQKSLKLMSDIIKVHTDVGQTILDPFMGSGTTGEGALMNYRNFIGVELDDNYFKMADTRLSKYQQRLM